MADAVEREQTADEVQALLAEARRKKEKGNFQTRDAKGRRKAEQKQRKGRVNANLLRGDGTGRDETWTIRAKPAHVRAVKELSEHLSEPGAKVSIAALMDEAIELLLAKHRGGEGTNDA